MSTKKTMYYSDYFPDVPVTDLELEEDDMWFTKNRKTLESRWADEDRQQTKKGYGTTKTAATVHDPPSEIEPRYWFYKRSQKGDAYEWVRVVFHNKWMNALLDLKSRTHWFPLSGVLDMIRISIPTRRLRLKFVQDLIGDRHLKPTKWFEDRTTGMDERLTAETHFINEQGLHELLFLARRKTPDKKNLKDVAKAFTAFVAGNVLPKLRRDGTYTMPAGERLLFRSPIVDDKTRSHLYKADAPDSDGDVGATKRKNDGRHSPRLRGPSPSKSSSSKSARSDRGAAGKGRSRSPKSDGGVVLKPARKVGGSKSISDASASSGDSDASAVASENRRRKVGVVAASSKRARKVGRSKSLSESTASSGDSDASAASKNRRRKVVRRGIGHSSDEPTSDNAVRARKNPKTKNRSKRPSGGKHTVGSGQDSDSQ